MKIIEAYNNSFSPLSASNFPLQLPKGFKYGMLTINGLKTHIDELRVLLTDYQFDILAINETKIDSTIDDGLVRVIMVILLKEMIVI